MGRESSRNCRRQPSHKSHFQISGTSPLPRNASDGNPSLPINRLIAIGDIHGCIHALEALLEAIQPAASDQVVVLGDFIDGGRDTKAVIDRLMALERECRLVTILGNHEEMLLGALENPKLIPQWLDSGGIYTLNSYRYLGGMDAISPEHVEFIRRAKAWHETNEFFFTHANYDPDLPLPEQPVYLLRWAVLEPPYPRRIVRARRRSWGIPSKKPGKFWIWGISNASIPIARVMAGFPPWMSGRTHSGKPAGGACCGRRKIPWKRSVRRRRCCLL